MKSGANYVVLAKLNIDIANVDEVIFTFAGKKKVTKYYPSDVSYNDGIFAIPLYQDDTEQLEGSVRVEAQINYIDGSVQKSDIAELYIASTLATRKVENDNPSGTDTKEVEFSIVGNAIIAKIEGDIDPADIEKAVKDYLDEHPVKAGISEEECIEIVTNAIKDKADKSEIPSLNGYATEQWVEDKGYLTEHQQLKTINGQSIVGSGNIEIQGGGSGSGDITTKIFIDTLSANRYRDFAFRDFTKTQIALVVDDCLPTVISLCVTNAKAKNVPLNMSAISEYFDVLCTKGNTSATVLDEIKRGIANGGEVLLHGNGTINADNINDESFLKQKFLTEKEVFISRGLNPRGAIVIGGGNEIYNDARTDRWVRALYDYSDGWGIGEPYAHRRLAPTTLDSAKAYIDDAVANKKFIVIFAHKWHDFWDEMIDYARSLGAEFVTYANVYDTFGTTKSVKAMENRIKALEQGGGSTKVLTGISATKTKTEYNVNDTLNVDDITVIAHYSDESTEIVTSEATIDSNAVIMSSSGTYSICVSYNGQSTTISIEVADVPSPSGTVIYEIASISGTCNGTTDAKVGSSSTSWTSGKQYRYEFDYEVTAVGSDSTTVSIRDADSNDLGVNLTNATVGMSGHVDRTNTSKNTRTRQAFLLKNVTNTTYSVKFTNVKVTEL